MEGSGRDVNRSTNLVFASKGWVKPQNASAQSVTPTKFEMNTQDYKSRNLPPQPTCSVQGIKLQNTHTHTAHTHTHENVKVPSVQCTDLYILYILTVSVHRTVVNAFKGTVNQMWTHILWARSQWRLNSERWRLICVDPQYWTCFLSPFWCLEFWTVCKLKKIRRRLL